MPTFPRRRKPGTQPKGPRFSRLKKRFAPRTQARAAGERSRGIYLLPNAFTTAALFCGFYAIVMAMNQRFDQACWAVFIAMILDGLDGRIARLTNTQSEFGAQYDSLADMVSFGAAPALVMYEWSLNGLGKVGWVAAFIYCACAALRLARFNTNIEVVDKRFIPRKVEWVSWCITVFAGLTMVSNVPFYSFKDINFRKSVPFIAVFLIALVLALLAIDPPKVLWPIFVIYGLSGYAVYVWQRAKGKRVSIIPLDDADDHLHR